MRGSNQHTVGVEGVPLISQSTLGGYRKPNPNWLNLAALSFFGRRNQAFPHHGTKIFPFSLGYLRSKLT